MNDKWGTLIYLIILAVIGVAGALKKKRQQQGDNVSSGKKETASVFEKLITGTGITDVLPEEEKKPDMMNPQVLAREPDMTEEMEEVEREMKYGSEPAKKEIPVKEGESFSWNTEGYFLSPEQEGVTVFNQMDKKNDTAYATQRPNDSNYEQEEKTSFLDEIMEDFDPVKAIIYSEILDRKYF